MFWSDAPGTAAEAGRAPVTASASAQLLGLSPNLQNNILLQHICLHLSLSKKTGLHFYFEVMPLAILFSAHIFLKFKFKCRKTDAWKFKFQFQFFALFF